VTTGIPGYRDKEGNVSQAVWERCEGCGHEYRYPHLCRAHHLCGLCHPLIEASDG